jgi:cytolysin (calcineurin-like family phosphatase)
MFQNRSWLAPYTWDFVTLQNAALCQAKNALHKPTSDGHAQTQELWNNRHAQLMSLEEAVDLCRRCHKMAPFCFYNGNTFAAIIRDVIATLELEGAKAYLMRSLAGHIVAGVATDEEVRAFHNLCTSLEA